MAPQAAQQITTAIVRGANSSQQQQIIVIPQSMLANTNLGQVLSAQAVAQAPAVTTQATQKKPVIKLSPKVEQRGLKRALPPLSPPLRIATTQPKTILNTPITVVKQEEEEDDDLKQGAPVRKRANLDHLSPEEKLMRRKLKNRVAAQNARDKKRMKMEEMEELIRGLEEDRQRLREENQRLASMNERLQAENTSLRSGQAAIKDEMPPSPPMSLPRSPLPPSTSPSPFVAGTAETSLANAVAQNMD